MNGEFNMQYNFSKNISTVAPSAIREILKLTANPNIIAFAAGNPAPESFPADKIAEITADILNNNSTVALSYGASEGYTKLRNVISERIKEKFSVGTENDVLLITSGGQQALELTCKVLCDRGDTIICENPSYIGAVNAFKTMGANIVGVDMDDDGINIEKLEAALKTEKNVKLIYLIPNFQNPMGVTLSLEKRTAVLELAKKYNVVILEDNPYGELYFDKEPPLPIKSLDTEGLVVYCSSFSKILSSGMRVGYACAPFEIAQKMVVAKQTEDVHTNMLFQMMCHKFMTECDFDGHISKIRELYSHKCKKMLSALDKYMPNGVSYTKPTGGLFVWLTIPKELDISVFISRSLEKGVAIIPGKAFIVGEDTNSVRLSYSMVSDEQIERGIKILAETLREMMR